MCDDYSEDFTREDPKTTKFRDLLFIYAILALKIYNFYTEFRGYLRGLIKYGKSAVPESTSPQGTFIDLIIALFDP